MRLDINAGIRDGHEGSVPVSHSLEAFNALVDSKDRISEADITYIVKNATLPSHLQMTINDPAYGSKHVIFRKQSGKTRITLFDGGHEIIYEAAIDWLRPQSRSKGVL